MASVNVLSKWFPVIGYKNKIIVGKLFKSLIDKIKGSPTLGLSDIKESFDRGLNELAKECNANIFQMKSSGSGAFIGGISLSYSVFGQLRNVDLLSDLIMCYLYVDFILDSPSSQNSSSESNDSKKLLTNVSKIIQSDIINLSKGLPLDKSLEDLHPTFKLYRRMTQGDLTKIKLTLDLFTTEIKSVKIQNRSDLPRDTYLKLCQEKGESTTLIIAAVLGIDLSCPKMIEQIKLIGYAGQLMDDIIDIFDDMKDGITSIATYDYQNNGNIDDLFNFAFSLIDQFDPMFIILRYGLMLTLAHSVSRPYHIVTPELRRKVDPYIYLDYRYGDSLENILFSLVS